MVRRLISGSARSVPERSAGAPVAPAKRGPRMADRRLDQTVLQRLVGYNLRRAEVHMRQQVIKALSEWDIRPPEYSALTLIASNELVTQTDLGEALNIKRPNMVSMIERLEQRGLVRRTVHERDRRNHILSLTPKGDALLADTDGLIDALDLAATRCWSDRERRQMVALLQRFYLSVDNPPR